MCLSKGREEQNLQSLSFINDFIPVLTEGN
jgi:hypothetical protein